MSRTSKELRDRTKRFASSVIKLFTRLPRRREEVRVLGHQLLRSGTSVAANFREASRARSRAEFASKIDVCIQEADESELWLELLHEDCHVTAPEVEELLVETNELISIFVAMASRTKAND